MADKIKAAAEVETSSRIPVNPLYTPADLKGSDYEGEVGYPGEYPFTRGVQATMYRGRLWTMRQYAGMGDAAEAQQKDTQYFSGSPRPAAVCAAVCLRM